MNFTNKVVIITGAASGIGLALSKELHKRGAEVVLADVQQAPLLRAAETLGCRSVVVDVCDADAMRDMVQQEVSHHGRLDYIFNNAGILVSGKVKDTPLSDWKRVFDVNVHGVINGIDAAYPVFIEQGFGHIVNTASIAGLIPCPGLVAYSASKHAVVGLSTGLREEAERYGVKVSVVCPGFVKTNIVENGLSRGHVSENLAKSVPWTDVGDCARDILKGVAKNKAIIVVTRHGKILTNINRLAPTSSAWLKRTLGALRK
ncbi:MAG: SDR family NAD(P)-dependent oxidoreductase [Kofleriaceae bacterium]|nr:SDR family NAD(P)-dependent oxidoreductase [Kofleriaceae bacterium]